ncbi:hypothetical protein AHAS_Ahas16G0325600 [Arachis hypogaea]
MDKPVGREEDQNGKSEPPQNQPINFNDQSNADFGPWMLVRRYGDKRKAQFQHKKSQVNQMPIPSYISKKDGSPKGKESGQGSRFVILQEEKLGNTPQSMDGLDKIQEDVEEIGPQQTKAQEGIAKTQPQKRVLKTGAGKNSQTPKKAVSMPRGPLEQGGKPNLIRNREKISESAVTTPKGKETSTRATKGKGKDPELEGMEMVIKEYMRNMEKDQWEAFQSMKEGRMNLHQHAVRDNLLLSSESNPKKPGSRLGAPGPRGNLKMQAEISMVEAGARGGTEDLADRDQVDPEYGARPIK